MPPARGSGFVEVGQARLNPPTGPFRQSLYVPVRDGTRLAMNVLRSAVDGVLVTEPPPVLFAFTPCRARYRDASGRVVTLSHPELNVSPARAREAI